jgi:microsomal dipeptidase-like Zn-dependent dipeptidase
MKNSIRPIRLFSLCMFLFLIINITSFCQDEVDKLHKESFVWDCHNDLVYRVLYEKLDIGDRLPAGHVDILRLKEGQVDVQTVALFVQNFLYPDKCAQQAFQLIEAMKKAIDKNADSVELARTGADVERIVKAGKIAGVDHVGLGADMYPRTPSPVGIRGAQDYPNITRGLKKRGYSDEDIEKILGGNFLRVWKTVTNKDKY